MSLVVDRQLEIGNHYLRSGRVDEAISVFSKLLPNVLNQTRVDVYIGLGRCYMKKGQARIKLNNIALEYFEAALKLDSQNSEAKFLKAKCLKQNQIEEKGKHKSTSLFSSLFCFDMKGIKLKYELRHR